MSTKKKRDASYIRVFIFFQRLLILPDTRWPGAAAQSSNRRGSLCAARGHPMTAAPARARGERERGRGGVSLQGCPIKPLQTSLLHVLGSDAGVNAGGTWVVFVVGWLVGGGGVQKGHHPWQMFH